MHRSCMQTIVFNSFGLSIRVAEHTQRLLQNCMGILSAEHFQIASRVLLFSQPQRIFAFAGGGLWGWARCNGSCICCHDGVCARCFSLFDLHASNVCLSVASIDGHHLLGDGRQIFLTCRFYTNGRMRCDAFAHHVHSCMFVRQVCRWHGSSR